MILLPILNDTSRPRIPESRGWPCNLGFVKLPWQKSDDTPAEQSTPAATNTSPSQADSAPLPKGYTPPKGRPTPSRREQEISRGVIRDPNAMTAAQAGQRRKELKKSMSKEEWKEYKRKEREESRERNRIQRERLDSGDERYLLDRDKGAERRYVRNWVDSKRFFNNMFMPFAAVLLVTLLLMSFAPDIYEILSLVLWVAIIAFLIEGVIIGRRVNKATRIKFPETTEAGFRLGFYAWSRATQPRKWRTPRPQVELGATV